MAVLLVVVVWYVAYKFVYKDGSVIGDLRNKISGLFAGGRPKAWSHGEEFQGAFMELNAMHTRTASVSSDFGYMDNWRSNMTAESEF